MFFLRYFWVSLGAQHVWGFKMSEVENFGEVEKQLGGSSILGSTFLGAKLFEVQNLGGWGQNV